MAACKEISDPRVSNGKRTRLSAEDLARLERAMREGATRDALMREFHLGQSRIMALRQRFGLGEWNGHGGPRPTRWPRELVERATQAWLAEPGVSQDTIAERFGITRAVLNNHCSRNEIRKPHAHRGPKGPLTVTAEASARIMAEDARVRERTERIDRAVKARRDRALACDPHASQWCQG